MTPQEMMNLPSTDPLSVYGRIVSMSHHNLIDHKTDQVPDLHWVALLSDEVSIYQNDEADAQIPTWLRLKAYLAEKNLRLEQLSLRFRSHHEVVERSEIGYYYAKGVGATWGEDSISYFVAGPVFNDHVNLTWWRVPEIIPERTESRLLSDCKEDFIILNSRAQPCNVTG